jgi:hypothetical protein
MRTKARNLHSVFISNINIQTLRRVEHKTDPVNVRVLLELPDVMGVRIHTGIGYYFCLETLLCSDINQACCTCGLISRSSCCYWFTKLRCYFYSQSNLDLPFVGLILGTIIHGPRKILRDNL